MRAERHATASCFVSQLPRVGVLGVAVVFVHSAACSVNAQHLDIMLYRQGTQLRVGGFDFGASPSVLPTFRVFREATTYIPAAAPGVAFTSSPGWNALALPTELPAGGQTLQGLAGVFVAGPVLPGLLSGRNLGYWSGEGPVTFGAVPSGEVLQHSVPDPFGGGRLVVYDATASAVSPLLIGNTAPTGGMHNHPSYAIYGNADRQGSSLDAPTQGVYLAALQASMEGHLDADPVFAVFGVGVTPHSIQTASLFVRSIVDPTLIHGDANLDGIVDFADLVQLARHFNTATNVDWSKGDFNFDMRVDFADLVTMARNFNTGSGSGDSFESQWRLAQSTVPEPATMSITFAAAIACLARRRRLRSPAHQLVGEKHQS
jgi:hypothetical protein